MLVYMYMMFLFDKGREVGWRLPQQNADYCSVGSKGLQTAAFMSCLASWYTTILKSYRQGCDLAHLFLKFWLGVGKGLLPVKNFIPPTDPFFCQSNFV